MQANSTPPAKRAASYCRVSSDRQEEGLSLEDQERVCREYAQAHGFDVEHVYREVFDSEETERPVFKAMLAADKRGEAEIVIVWKQDRLGRGQKAHEVCFYMCELAGLEPHCVTEPYNDTSEGRMMRGMRNIVSGEERSNITVRPACGRKARARSGKLIPGSRPLYGYRFVDAGPGKGQTKVAYELNPETAPIVQRIYREIAEGKTLTAVAEGLHRDGISTPSGTARWLHSHVRPIAKNPRYAGMAYAYESDKRERVRLPDGRRASCRRARPDDERVPLPEGTIPPLVSSDLFARVQDRLARNKAESARRNRDPHAFLLRAGFVRCGVCRKSISTLWHNDGRGHMSRPAYAIHGRPGAHEHCHNNTSIAAVKLDAEVWDWLTNLLLHPERIAARIAAIERGDDTTADELAAVEKAIAAVNKRIAGLMKMAEAVADDDDMAAEVAARLKALAAERRGYEEQRAEAQAWHTAWEESRAAVNEVIEQVRKLRDGIVTPENKRALIEAGAAQARYLRSLDYDRKRDILHRFGVTVYLFPEGAPQRWTAKTTLGQLIDNGPTKCASTTRRSWKSRRRRTASGSSTPCASRC